MLEFYHQALEIHFDLTGVNSMSYVGLYPPCLLGSCHGLGHADLPWGSSRAALWGDAATSLSLALPYAGWLEDAARDPDVCRFKILRPKLS
jgi:hypothetical protein